MVITILLFAAGTLLVLYGLAVASIVSGTRFFLIWLALGGLCFLAAACRVSGFSERIPVWVKAAAAITGTVCLAVLVYCTVLIGTRFAARGEDGADYMIVLGAQVREDGPSAVLRYRLEAACDYLRPNPETRCIVSGGQGSNEPFSEAEGMRRYLEEAGIGADRIFMEDESVNTAQNMEYSLRLIQTLSAQEETAGEEQKEAGEGEQSSDARVVIVTNNFHMYRALAIARKAGLEEAQGVAAGSSAFYLPNNVLRECLGILKDKICGNM